MARLIFFVLISLLALGSCSRLWLDVADEAEEQAEVNRLVLSEPWADAFLMSFPLTEENYMVFIAQVRSDTAHVAFKKEPSIDRKKIWEQADKEAKKLLMNFLEDALWGYLIYI